MSPLNRLLILSASYGEGHQQAANAVRDALTSLSPHTEVQIVDHIREVHPRLDSFAKYCYLKSVRFAPKLYGWWYKGTSQIQPESLIQRQLNSLGLEELEDKLNRFQPDAVLATFPTPAGVVSYLKQQGRADVPLATVITDHAIHSQWIHPQTDLYFVGSSYVRQGLVGRGVAGDAIVVSGIPVRPKFLHPLDRPALQRKYHLNPNLPTVLIMGGAYGVMGDIQQVCDELFNYPDPIQIIVVTGRNRKMKASLDDIVKQAKNPVWVFGFVTEVQELMAVCDVMLTKAGGLTISEALAMQVPMLLYRPIPGQEVQNAKFLCNAGAAVLARNRREVMDNLRQLLILEPERREAMRRQAGELRKLHAAEEIASGLMELANRGKNRAHYLYQH